MSQYSLFAADSMPSECPAPRTGCRNRADSDVYEILSFPVSCALFLNKNRAKQERCSRTLLYSGFGVIVLDDLRTARRQTLILPADSILDVANRLRNFLFRSRKRRSLRRGSQTLWGYHYHCVYAII